MEPGRWKAARVYRLDASPQGGRPCGPQHADSHVDEDLRVQPGDQASFKGATQGGRNSVSFKQVSLPPPLHESQVEVPQSWRPDPPFRRTQCQDLPIPLGAGRGRQRTRAHARVQTGLHISTTTPVSTFHSNQNNICSSVERALTL